MNSFIVGDIVEAWGLRGEVTRTYTAINKMEMVHVSIGGHGNHMFYSDGRKVTWHKEPTLKLIERKKVYKEVVMECFGNVYGDMSYNWHDSELEAVGQQCIGCLNPTNKNIKIIYQVEE
jgi:hypothetical protein